MKCHGCGKEFEAGDEIIPVLFMIEDRLGNKFLSEVPKYLIHLKCLKEN